MRHRNGRSVLRGMLKQTPQPKAYFDELTKLLDVEELDASSGGLSSNGFSLQISRGDSHELVGMFVDNPPGDQRLLHG